MEDFLKDPEKRGFNPVFLVAILIGMVLIGGAIFLLSRTPSYEDQTAKILEGAYRAGSPEFDSLQKSLLIVRDEKNTIESPTGRGTISMYVPGTVYNRTGKTITVLLVNVTVIDQQNKPIRSKDVLVIPGQHGPIGPGESATITCTVDGFGPREDRANVNLKVAAVKYE